MHSHKIINILEQNTSLQKKLSRELNIHPVVAQVLINRGITTTQEAERFILSRLSDTPDPFLFLDMPKAVQRIKEAVRKKEKVLLFGDYDVDGITSIAILKKAFGLLGLKTEHYLPHRIKEGYGLGEEALRIICQKKADLLITADCGISSVKEVKDLTQAGIDVIITDHHQPLDEHLPFCAAILNPKTKNSGYPEKDLAGVGVIYKLAQALLGKKAIEFLDLVALGTIADLVSLIGENRVIVKEGLKRMPLTQNKGLKALIKKARLRSVNFTPQMVSFILAPRLNASGRISSAKEALDLLLADSEEEAEKIACLLEERNSLRQSIEAKILQEAEEIIEKEFNFKEHKVIVLAKPNWHVGVLGVVASKLVDKFYRPTIVISLTEDVCKGSARSVKNFHLFEALKGCSQYLRSFGGHSHAAGLTIKPESVAQFKESINRLASQKLTLEDILPSVEVDMQLSLADLGFNLARELEKLSPFGVGNPQPLFLTKDLKLKSEPQVLSRNTLKFYATDGKLAYEVIAFGMSNLKGQLLQADAFDLVYSLRLDTWQDEERLFLKAEEIFLK